MAAVSKVVYGDTTIIDLTSDTVSANEVLQGTTAHGADGEAVTGSAPWRMVAQETLVFVGRAHANGKTLVLSDGAVNGKTLVL